ncbi:hypothetical protein GALMADRAFT_159537 [Galerina marginata CBS 339.88]|uniref:Uncharacterized protein n=1 Tax=Galerina marginata (strain CBS 339.88) TaxID=685588 RepID=A0A067SKF6_GALM3|nr:hypothetical protein GALMADRAFT_159537 [Galerina marginata CBS 339.88]
MSRLTTEPESSGSRNPTLSSWHPKITPYRAIVLTSTVGFGTAKGVLAQRGSTIASITVEWLLGTVIFLLMFSVNAYDSDSGNDAPRFLSWLFQPDCMNSAWRVLATISVPCPRYTSEERPTISDPNSLSEHPPITFYRILVCSVVTAFGMSKAVLGYYGFSTAVTWTDWALAVPITTSLYVLGLYEYNSLDVWSSFFVTHRSKIIYSVGTWAAILISFAWVLAWCYVLRFVPDLKIKSTHPNEDSFSSWRRTFNEEWSPFGYKLFAGLLIFMPIAGGVAVIFFVLRSMSTDVVSNNGPYDEGDFHTRSSWYSRYRNRRIFALIDSMFYPLLGVGVDLFFFMGCCTFSLILTDMALDFFDPVIEEGSQVFSRVPGFLLSALCAGAAFCSMLGALSMLIACLVALFKRLKKAVPASAFKWRRSKSRFPDIERQVQSSVLKKSSNERNGRNAALGRTLKLQTSF